MGNFSNFLSFLKAFSEAFRAQRSARNRKLFQVLAESRLLKADL
jgi:hypothetical protein